MVEMKEDVRQMWVTDLLSDNFEQARNDFTEMSDTGVIRYCCLAVLTKRAEQFGIVKFEDEQVYVPPCLDHKDPIDTDICNSECEFDTSVPQDKWVLYEFGDLPEIVRRWAGLEARDPVLRVRTVRDGYLQTEQVHDSAITCNDTHQMSFEEIAALVRGGS